MNSLQQQGKATCRDEALVEHFETIERVPLDLLDPHRAAMEDNPEEVDRPSLITCLAVISLALSYMCPISCGFALVTGIIVQIGTDLGDTTNLAWVVGGWSVASSVSFSMAGSLSDTFGRRWTIICGQVTCCVGSIVAATAQSLNAVIVGSTLLGFGCGIIFVSYAGISEILPNKWRGTGLALTETAINIPFGIPNVLLSNQLYLHTALKWRWCYYMGLITGVISLIGVLLFYFPPPRPQYDHNKSRIDEIREIDFIGIILYSGGLTVFLIGLTWGGQADHGWASPSVITPLIIGVVILCLSFAYDFTLAKNPFFPLDIFVQIRDFSVLLGIVFVAGSIYYSMSALLPAGSLYIFTNNPLEIGLLALPNGVAQFLFGAVATAFMGKIKHLKAQMILGLLIQTLGTGCLATVHPTRRVAWSALQVLALGPFALVCLIAYVIAGLNIPLRYLGLATGLIGTFRSMGGSVGNAIFNTILNSVIRGKLANTIAAAAVAEGFDPTQLDKLIPATSKAAVGVPFAFQGIPGMTTTIEESTIRAFREVYAEGYRKVFYSTIPFGVVALGLAVCMRDPSQYLTNHTAIHLTKDRILARSIRTVHKKEQPTQQRSGLD